MLQIRVTSLQDKACHCGEDSEGSQLSYADPETPQEPGWVTEVPEGEGSEVDRAEDLPELGENEVPIPVRPPGMELEVAEFLAHSQPCVGAL